MSIKELSLSYDAVNENNTFTNGDIVQGRVFLEVTKEVKMKTFYIKCKGDADVSWSEKNSDDNDDTYHSHERYFKIKQFFIVDSSKQPKNEPDVILVSGETYSSVIRPGRHVYPFCFQLPDRSMPPSFKGSCGSVKYTLEVVVDRSWKMDRTATAEINFVPRVVADDNLLSPQSAAKDKKMKVFTSGSASMRATIDRIGYVQGDVITVSTDVDNSSSRELKLKYRLEQKQSFYAQGSSNYSSKTIFKVVGDPIPSKSKQTVNTSLMIPPNLELTIANCDIIKVDYILKVYLDVPYASDPEIIFSVVILPAGQPGFQPYGFKPPAQPVLGPSAPSADYGPAPGLYPSLYPTPPPVYPQPGNPHAPPPSYTDLYPNPNPTNPEFQPAFNQPYPANQS